MSPDPVASPSRPDALGRYFLLSYALVLANMAGFLLLARWQGALGTLYLLATYVTYAAFYLAPVFVPLVLFSRLARRLSSPTARRNTRVAVLVLAVLGTSAIQLLLYADGVVFRMFGFHVNGFVWNLLVTDGGVESLGASESTSRSVGLIAAGILALQIVAAAVAWRSVRRSVPARAARRWPVRVAWALLIALSSGERLAFAVSEQVDYRPVTTESDRFPFYMALHWSGLGDLLGVERSHEGLAGGVDADSQLQYPLAPLAPLPAASRLNVVWLVAESLRADALDPVIMPGTWAFASSATRFTGHRSGGNGTRMGMFSMFYGLPGSYWFPFLRARRGPVLMDELLAADYQLALYSSSRFTYPEFDKTIFAAVPTAKLSNRVPGLAGWENDRRHVSSMLRFLDGDGRDVSKPFMTFLFFESPHAQYDFPDESVIARPYMDDLDYATMDRERDMPLVWNRYVNACHHLDGQLTRIFEGLAERGLLDSTIVIMTGDHGEEFMEHGRWGHNSEFTEQQIRVPLVIHAPGRDPAVVDRLTSHLDLPATVLALLGVTSPPSDYCLGFDLFGSSLRADCLVADWDRLGLMAQGGKIVVPMQQGDFSAPRVTTADDEVIDDDQAERLLARYRPRLLELFAETARFRR